MESQERVNQLFNQGSTDPRVIDDFLRFYQRSGGNLEEVISKAFLLFSSQKLVKGFAFFEKDFDFERPGRQSLYRLTTPMTRNKAVDIAEVLFGIGNLTQYYHILVSSGLDQSETYIFPFNPSTNRYNTDIELASIRPERNHEDVLRELGYLVIKQ